MGYVFPQQKFKSIGLQMNAVDHTQNSYFGLTNYNANQKSFYGNLIYQSIISSTIHKFRTGLSFQYDNYHEALSNTHYARKEIVPGAFFEYTYTPNEKWSMVAGLRGDNNNLFGDFITPRLNVRYEPAPGTVIRFSAGRGQRTANIFAENNSVMVSARQLVIVPSTSNGGYGLLPEVAWNKGISVDQKFNLFGNPATLSLDFFRNDFSNQVIVDLENTRAVSFYNLTGKSFSNSFQSELEINPVKRLDIRLAYRFFDVRQTYSGQLLERPFIAKHRAFISMDYNSVRNWKFNYTINYNGAKRITNTSLNPANFQLGNYSPDYFLMNAQLSKSFEKKYPMDFYIGVENITNFLQQTAIVSAAQPFSPYFDASMIWGPTTGSMLYVGWRIKMN
jgi:outer membrane receptor for ferrienterochelin and colicin